MARVLPLVIAVVLGASVAVVDGSVEAKSRHSGDAFLTLEGEPSPALVKIQKPSPSEHLDVLFISSVPETDIFIQGEKIGTTGKDRQLLVKLLPGKYRVTASRTDYLIRYFEITVSPRKTSFDLPMGVPLPRPTATPTPSPIPTPQQTADNKTGDGAGRDGGGSSNPAPTPTPTPASGAAILERFLDPKTTDQVKQSDWQTVLTSTYQELAREPNNPQFKAQAQFAQGQVDYLDGNFANALDAFSGALRIAPDYALASYGMGNVYLATNQPLQAVKALERAVSLNPKLAVAFKSLGDAWLVLKKEKEGRAAYAQAYELGYKPTEASVNIARNLVKSERWAEALAALKPIAAESPSAEVYILLGDSYVGQKQTVNAFQAYTKATELDRNSARAHYKLGEIQLRERNYEEAREALERAIILDPDGRVIDRRRAREMADDASEKLRKMKEKLNKSITSKP